MAGFLGGGDRFTPRLNAPLAVAVVLHVICSYMTATLRTFLWARVAYPTGFPPTATRRGLVHAIEALDPEGLSIPHMLHVEVGVFFNEFDGRAFVCENFERCTPTSFTPFILVFLASVGIHTDIDLPLR